MRLNICSCLLVFVLGCKVTAAIKHEVVEEKQSVSLPCPHSVEGEVTWSRETSGHRVDILTAHGDGDKKHISDPGRRYSSQTDKSLHIRSVTVSDSGTYLCNNAAAVELTVIPSGTIIRNATEKTIITLNCPHDVGGSDVPTWSKDRSEVQENIWVYVSPVDKTLTLTHVQPGDSGLYYCDGKPAVYLTVMEAETSDRGKKKTTPPPTTTKPTTKPTTTTTTMPTTMSTTKPTTTKKPTKKRTKKRTTTTKPTMTTLTTTASPSSSTVAPPEQKPPLPLVIRIVVPLLLIILLLIFYLIHRRRFKRRGVERVSVPTDAFCMVECPGGSNPNDPTYYTIPDRQPMENTTDTSGPDESPYSEICEPFTGGNNKEDP